MSSNLLSIMDQFFDDGVRPVAYTLGRNFVTTPALNVRELKDRYEITVAAPGIDPSKAKVELKENILSISYENKTQEAQEGDMMRQEYHEHISFSRSLSLPKNVNSDSIKAKYSKGILTVSVIKLPEAKPKSVNIEIAD